MTNETVVDIENEESLLGYLRGRRRINPEERPLVRVLAGGVSNKTVLVERENGDAWVLKQALAKLRVAVDWFSSPERIHREALGMRQLGKLAPTGTITRLIDDDIFENIIIMEAVPQPHENWKTMLLRGDVREGHVTQFADILSEIHRHSQGRAAIASEFDDRRFFESLRLEPYYGYALEHVPEAAFLGPLISDTRERRFALVHGDYSPKNVLVTNDRGLVLLDHEVVHYGDPAFDVGFALTHLLSKAHHIDSHRREFAEMASSFWRTYIRNVDAAAWDPDLERYAVKHTLGCLLARVAGRSPLEYLSDDEKTAQKRAVLALASRMPKNILLLIDLFITELEPHA